MDKERIQKILEDVKTGSLDIDTALGALRSLPFEDLGYAKIDHHRSLRTGYPEVIFCTGKSVKQITGIVEEMSRHNNAIIATRAEKEVFEAVKKIREDSVYNHTARLIITGKTPEPVSESKIAIVSAGTSDIPVAEEAAAIAESLGNRVNRLFDVGVAGIHRLLDNIKLIMESSVLVVVAGMDGVLPSIVGGLVDKPVIAVPTSVGYGASFDGLAALLTMLNSCAPGVAVMNIDNGFGAGYFASMLNREK
jgi:pyridinium-3,5-biscarboxylic acid mononucleotide synthase